MSRPLHAEKADLSKIVLDKLAADEKARRPNKPIDEDLNGQGEVDFNHTKVAYPKSNDTYQKYALVGAKH